MELNSILGVVLKPISSFLQETIKKHSTRVSTFEAIKMDFPDINTIWSVSDYNFNEIALQMFHYQAKNNAVYAKYLQLIDQNHNKIEHYSEIPFLPITFFKTHEVKSSHFNAESVFESSSTTGINTSKHFVKSLDVYHQNCKRIIERKTGPIENYEILGLLPNYLERKNSSLVSMVEYFIHENKQDESFYLYDFDGLKLRLASNSKKKLLFGVSFALLDFAEKHANDSSFTIIETGGMKGRKAELTKEQVYAELRTAFPNATLFSEYGMTELMSQAYSNQAAIYSTPPWMKVLPRVDNDPFKLSEEGKTAALNIIDLANINSCCFIATDDLGKVYKDGSFEVIGRLDNADLRGCSLMIN